ncbi:hypothetical protein [Alkalilimnicola ehrlichii]|uniref:hypothetical protein n=1 Tax=Alkalilimnicola ehrlichii TaxID=351052 RepID=UPI0011C02470|nr:hypothetical protein [Alkalilimnicola ehrlichii]
MSSRIVTALDAREAGQRVEVLSTQFGQLRQAFGLPDFANASERAQDADALRRTAYQPAHDLRNAAGFVALVERFERGEALRPDDLRRAFPQATWLGALRGFHETGVTVAVADEAQLRQFEADIRKAKNIRSKLTDVQRKRRRAAHARHRATTREQQERSQLEHRKQLADRDEHRRELAAVEERIRRAMRPVGPGAGQVGVRIQGLTEAQQQELRRMAADFQAGRAYTPSAARGLFVNDGLAAIIFAMQIGNLVQFVRAMEDGDDTAKARNRLRLIGHVIAAAAAGSALAQGVAVTVFSARLDRFASRLAREGVAANLGRLTAMFGYGAYGLGTLTSLAATVHHGRQWTEALRTGNRQAMAGATLSMVGSAGVAGSQAWGLGQTRKARRFVGQEMARGASRSAAWASASGRLLSVFLRVNLAGLVFTAIQLAGEWWYNRNQRSALDRWLEQGPWGDEDAGWEAEDAQRRFLAITALPKVEVRTDNGEPSFRIIIPDLDEADLADQGLGLYALPRPTSDNSEEWSQTLASLASLQALSPLTLSFPVCDNEQKGRRQLSLGIQYASSQFPDMPRAFHFGIVDLRAVTPGLWHRLNLRRIPEDAKRTIEPLENTQPPLSRMATLRLEDLSE